MSDSGNIQNGIANIRKPENFFFNQVAKERHADKAVVVPEQPTEPVPPPNLKQAIATGLKSADAKVQAFNAAAAQAASVTGAIADPGALLASTAGAAADEKMSNLVSGMAAALGPFPAATITGLSLGIPHAHIKHPPSGPPPLPPIPLPPLGPILLGTNLTVLINNKPTARCGDWGMNPTCCGIIPPLSALYEITTGSSSVYIGGSRAARSGIDITMHCFSIPSPKIPIKLGKLAAIAGKIGKVAGAAGKVAGAAAKVAGVATIAAQVSQTATSFAEAEADDDAAMASAIGLSVAMMAAQAAADAAAAALTKMMGTDQPCIPPIGTPGMILMGSPNVMIGGFPLPSFSAIAQGLLKRAKGLRTGGSRTDKPAHNKSCTGAHPIDLVTGANIDEFIDCEIDSAIPFRWIRYYDSTLIRNFSPLGWGFRHEYQRVLRRNLDGFEYTNPIGQTIDFPSAAPGLEGVASDGMLLRDAGDGRFEIEAIDQPIMEFEFHSTESAAPITALRRGHARLTFLYNSSGWLKAVHFSNGCRVRLAYDELGHVVELRSDSYKGQAEGVLSTYEYDPIGQLVRASDAFGAAAFYEYDVCKRMIRNGYRNGYSFHYGYDESGRCSRSFGDDGLYDMGVEYYPLERLTIARYADGATSSYRHDERGTLTEIVDPAGGVEKFVTDDAGRVVQQIDPAGNITEWRYDDYGGHTARIDSLQRTYAPMHIEPNPPDPLAYELPETPLEWEFGNRLPPSDILELEPAYAPSSDIRVAVMSVMRHAQSGARNHLADGRSTPANPNASRSFDPLGRVTEEVDVRGHVQAWQYDEAGNLMAYKDRDGFVKRFEYSSWKSLSRETDPTGAVTTFEYTLREYLANITDPGGTVSEYSYDRSDQVVEVRYQGQTEERYRYDRAGNLIEKRDARGQCLIRYEVGAGNLDIARYLASGETHRYEYDGHGRYLVAASDRYKVEFAYDSAGSMLKDCRDGIGVEHEFAGGEIAATRYFGRFRVTYERDVLGDLIITDPSGGRQRLRVDAGGSVLRKLTNGSSEVGLFDADGRCVAKVRSRSSGDRPAWVRSFDYSAEGDLLAAGDSRSGITEYRYDAAHRLIEETLPDGTRREFIHDRAGNLIRQPGLDKVSIKAGNQLERANGEVFTYNDRNAISARRGPNSSTRYEYDSLDTLIRCDIDGEPWSAEYDALCRRVSKTWRGQTTEFYWDDFRVAAEVRHDGSLRMYVYPDEVSLVPFMFCEYDSVAAEPDTGRCYYVFTNQIGVPVSVEDEKGRDVWSARAAPFGSVQLTSPGAIDLSLRFPGHYHDMETGLHYNRFRHYSPALGRYLESDPLGYAGGTNPYAYSANPLTEVDLDGLAHGRQRKKKPPGKSKAKPKGKSAASKAKKPAKAKPKKQNKPREPRTYEKKVTHRDGSTTYTLKTKKGKTIQVKYNKEGYPDFKPFMYKGDQGKGMVPIKQTGDNTTDFRAANKKAGFGEGATSEPDGYTWHHHENGKDMILVDSDAHGSTPHTGGASKARAEGT